MKPFHGPVLNASRWLTAAALPLLLVACGAGKSSAPSQVALTVNGDEVSVHQVDLLLQGRAAALPPPAASAAAQAVLQTLVDQELAAQAARRQGLDRDPRVLQLMEAAKRQVLAKAYQDSIGDRAIDASSDEIDRYHDAHPELFSKRRLYQLQETTVAVPASKLEAFKQQTAGVTSAARIHEIVKAQGLVASVRFLSVSPEDLPMPVLAQLAPLGDGQALVLQREGRYLVLAVLATQPAPVGRAAAQRLIAQFLVNERKRDLVQRSMQSLRNQARIEFGGPYAALGAAPNTAADADGDR